MKNLTQLLSIKQLDMLSFLKEEDSLRYYQVINTIVLHEILPTLYEQFGAHKLRAQNENYFIRLMTNVLQYCEISPEVVHSIGRSLYVFIQHEAKMKKSNPEVIEERETMGGWYVGKVSIQGQEFLIMKPLEV